MFTLRRVCNIFEAEQQQQCATQAPDKFFQIAKHGCAFFVKVRWEFQDFENRPILWGQFLALTQNLGIAPNLCGPFLKQLDQWFISH